MNTIYSIEDELQVKRQKRNTRIAIDKNNGFWRARTSRPDLYNIQIVQQEVSKFVTEGKMFTNFMETHMTVKVDKVTPRVERSCEYKQAVDAIVSIGGTVSVGNHPHNRIFRLEKMYPNVNAA